MSVHGNVVGRARCPSCASNGGDSSQDNLAIYEDGYATCYACDHYEYNNDIKSVAMKPKEIKPMITGKVIELRARNVNANVCSHYNYMVGEYYNNACQIATYSDSNGNPVAQKLRFKDKKFFWLGDNSRVGFYGQHLYRGGKSLVVTEGEVDALSVAQVLGKQWPCVSVPNGAKAAPKTFKDNIEWLSKFDSIVLFFDNDDAGREPIDEIVKLLPNKIKIASYPSDIKDANDLLRAGRVEDIKSAFWNAKEYTARDNDIIELADLSYEDVMSKPILGYSLNYPKLQKMIGGIRKGEITMLTAGSGIGKSTFSRKIAYGLAVDHGLKIGNVYLEEGQLKTAQGYIALDHGIPLGDLRANPNLISPEQFEETRQKLFVKSGMIALKHFGSMDCSRLISKLEYMTITKEVDFIVLDHISIVISGNESNDERKDLDILMTKLREFCERTGVGVIAIVHLKRPSGGKSFNEGREVSLADLRGSAAIEQLSDTVIALERNQQNEEERNYVGFRVLKCREFGNTGQAGYGQYNIKTGVIEPSDPPPSVTKGNNNNKQESKTNTVKHQYDENGFIIHNV